MEEGEEEEEGADCNMKSDLPREPTVIQSLCNQQLNK